jgi:hypothetical protein
VRVGVAVRDWKAETLVGDGVLGVPAVEVVAGEAGAVAEVLALRGAVATAPVRPSEPGHADALAGSLDAAGDLVAEDERKLRSLEFAVRDVEVGPAYAARLHSNEQLPGPRLGTRKVALDQRLPGLLQHHRAHDD